MFKSNPSPGIFIYEDFYPQASDLLAVVKEIAGWEYSAVPWMNSTHGDGTRGGPKPAADGYRNCVESTVFNVFQFADEDHAPLREELREYQTALNLVTSEINTSYGVGFKGDEGLKVLRYEKDIEYEVRVDPNLHNARLLTAHMFLNDDFTGGQIEFPYHDITVQPKAGTLVVFPPSWSYSFTAHSVEDGEKHVLLTWYR
ncbi:MAG TPA: hypothetical protein EYQ50_14085 [Verrucomicrobiales bacterium]|nr:hypothetical protein [Verrucomicrobiales bacterium]